MIENVTIGTDPEGWVIDKRTKRPVPITGLLGGSKDDPIEFIPGFGLQEDGCAWEFNTPPAKTKEEFLKYIEMSLEELSKRLPDHKIVIKPTMEFKKEDFTEDSQTIVGCSEDYNAYTLDVNPIPDLSISTKRYAGGHIHIGYKHPNMIDSLNIIKAMDLFVGLPLLVIDSDKNRKNIYGTPGRHRLKPYGVEYRSVSNIWLHNPQLIKYIFDQTLKAVDFVNSHADSLEEFEEMITALFENESIREINRLLDLLGIDRWEISKFAREEREHIDSFSKSKLQTV